MLLFSTDNVLELNNILVLRDDVNNAMVSYFVSVALLRDVIRFKLLLNAHIVSRIKAC